METSANDNNCENAVQDSVQIESFKSKSDCEIACLQEPHNVPMIEQSVPENVSLNKSCLPHKDSIIALQAPCPNENEMETAHVQSHCEQSNVLTIAQIAYSTKTSNNEILTVVPSCSTSQEMLEPISDKTIQKVESPVISKMTLLVDNSLPSTSKSCVPSKITSEALNVIEVGSKMDHMPAVNIYAEDNGPKFYNVTDSIVSKPIIPTKLSEAFSSLPVLGRPKQKSMLQQYQDNKIKEFVGCGLNDREFESLADYCSPDSLRTGDELIMNNNPGQGFYPSEMDTLTKNTNNFTANHDLNIVRKLKMRIEKDPKNLYCKRNKYRGIRMMTLGYDEDEKTPVVTLGTPVLPGKDLLFVIRWYRPFFYNPKDKNQYRTRHSVFSCNILMLGRQKLSLLRDRVVCPNDIDMRVDVSDRPDEMPRSSAREMFPSGFLFINNVFYVDTRKGCTDYSLPLRRWARAKGIGDFQTRDMCDVSLDQLTVKLGHPEVYVHQGNCEHLFTVSEIRLVNASDPLKLSAYPCHTALSQNQTIYCTTCAEFGAKWIVVGCDRVPFDPAFFCEKCFRLYLYKDGKKIGNFKAYLYRGNEINILKPQG